MNAKVISGLIKKAEMHGSVDNRKAEASGDMRGFLRARDQQRRLISPFPKALSDGLLREAEIHFCRTGSFGGTGFAFCRLYLTNKLTAS